jgi:hypothetical protein
MAQFAAIGSGFLGFGDFIFQFAYPVAFLGALFYGVTSIVSVDPATIIANKNVSVALNLFIGVCGLLSVFNWFSYKDPLGVGDILQVTPDRKIIKPTINSA